MEKNFVIDFHAHILPGMDHGCDDVEMSMKQLKMAADQNINIIIASSHFYPHLENVKDFLRRREAAWKSLGLLRDNVNPFILLGAEVLLCSNIDKMEGIEALCVENSNTLLIEMPYMRQWESSLIETVVRLRDKNGLEVVLAHGERYPVKEIGKLLERGFQIQVNVASTVRVLPHPFINRCMEQNLVAAFGSDIHGVSHNFHYFTKTMKKWGTKAVDVMEKTQKLLCSEGNSISKVM